MTDTDLVAKLRAEIIALSGRLAASESLLREKSIRLEQSGQNAVNSSNNGLQNPVDFDADERKSYPKTSAVDLLAVSASGSSSISPTAALLSSTALSYTDLFSLLSETQAALHAATRDKESLSLTLRQVLEDIEDRAPYLQAQREEYDRLSFECVEMTQKLAVSLSDSQTNADKFSAAQAECASLKADNDTLQLSLKNTTKQVETLLNKKMLDDHPQLEQELLQPSDIISAHLVTYRSIPELVDRNQQLLRLTTELSHKLEAGDRQLDDSVVAALQQAHDRVVTSRSEVDSAKLELAAKQSEMDMLQSKMIQLQQQLQQSARQIVELDDHASFGGDKSFDTNDPMLQDTSRDFSESFTLLNSDLSSASRQLSTSQIKLARQNARMEHLTQSLKTEQAVVHQLKAEMYQINQAKSSLTENLGKQEDLNTSLSKRLNNATTKLHTVESECRTALASLNMQNRTCDQLREHIDQLSNEKKEMTKVVSTVEGWLHTVKEQTSAQVTQLSTSLSERDLVVAELTDKLQNLSEISEQNINRKEIEITTLRDRIEMLTSEIALAKQSLSVSQEKCNNLKSTIATLGKSVSSSNVKAVFDAEVDNASTDELKQQLQESILEKEHAVAASEQYKLISQTSEAALTSLQSSYQEYQLSMDATLSTKQSEISGLSQEVDALKQNLLHTESELKISSEKLQLQKTEYESELKILKDSIADLSSIDTDNLSSEKQLKDQLELQVQATEFASSRYDQELLAHAEAIKTAGSLKDRLKTLTEEHNKLKELYEGSMSSLKTKTMDWETTESNFKSEIETMDNRIKDLKNQNDLLLTHIQCSNDQSTSISMETTTGSSESDSNVKSVISFLRKEKESAELKLELIMQEKSHLVQQLERVNASYLESQKSLEWIISQQQESASPPFELETRLTDISLQLEITKESNTTLRSEQNRLLSQITELETKAHASLVQIEPMKLEIKSLQAEISSKSQIISALEEDNVRWKTRNEQILNKYERTDPAELKQLKSQILELEAAKDAREIEVNAAFAITEEKRKRLVTHAGESQRRFISVKTELEAKSAQLEQNTKTLETLEDDVKSVKELLESNSKSHAATISTMQEQIESLQSSIRDLSHEKITLQKQLEETILERTLLRTQLDELTAKGIAISAVEDETTLSQIITGLKSDLATLQDEKNSLAKDKEALLALKETNDSMDNGLNQYDEDAINLLKHSISQLESKLQEAEIKASSVKDDEAVKDLESQLSAFKTSFSSSEQLFKDQLATKSSEIEDLKLKLENITAEHSKKSDTDVETDHNLKLQLAEEKFRKAEAEAHELGLKLKANEMKNKRLTSSMSTLKAQIGMLKESTNQVTAKSSDKAAESDKPQSLKISGAAKAAAPVASVSFMNAAAMLASQSADTGIHNPSTELSSQNSNLTKGIDSPEISARKRPGEEIKRPEESFSGSVKQVRKPEASP